MAKTGSVIGATVTDLTTMAADWARLGYSMAEAGKLAESTAILLNVSEFDDATEASEALISTMQAFQYTADESQHVVDILNEVGKFIARR
jgi:TP901 family phage tail tape measure protein